MGDIKQSIPVDLTELYTCRVVIFVETAPQSNKYYQVVLDKDQFKEVSDKIHDVHFGKGEFKNYKVSKDTIVLPENITSYQQLSQST